jgi:hypothetical protein
MITLPEARGDGMTHPFITGFGGFAGNGEGYGYGYGLETGKGFGDGFGGGSGNGSGNGFQVRNSSQYPHYLTVRDL